MNGKRFTEEKTRRSGFYLALAVCLVAVGIAAWSTYDAVNSYAANTESDQLLSQQAEEVRQGQETQEDSQEEDGEDITLSREEDQESSAAINDDPEAPREDEKVTETAGQPDQESSAAPTPTPQAAQEPEEASESESVQQVPATAPLYAISSEMIWPVSGGEAQAAYSAGTPVYSQTMKDWRIHTGLDVSAEAEAPVVACANGQVKETYTDSMLGNVVTVEHGDYLFYYCGVGENFLVNPGDVVSAGQQLGVVNAVPFEAAEEPHLHLEVRRDGVTLDPQAVLEGKA